MPSHSSSELLREGFELRDDVPVELPPRDVVRNRRAVVPGLDRAPVGSRQLVATPFAGCAPAPVAAAVPLSTLAD
ncbi:MAG: hypothetical protein H0T17_08785 [Propionibacteriales bacterium]|nr:hypothetical protein [Propionibacteriales bacterium]